MTDTRCVVCAQRPTPDGYACTTCAERARRQLAAIAELTPDARLVAAGLVHRGQGHTAGKPGPRPPLNPGATDALDEVTNALTTTARDIAETRGAQFVLTAFAGRGVPDPLTQAARWLSGQIEWLRHAVDGTEPRAIAAFHEIDWCVGRMRVLINGPRPGRYAGPCGYVDDDDRLCGEDVLAKAGASIAVCKACGSQYDVEQRQAWMRGEIESHLARPVEIAGVLLHLGFPIGYSTIAAYVAKGLIVAHGYDEQGQPRFRIGDVIEVRINAAKSRDAAHPVGG